MDVEIGGRAKTLDQRDSTGAGNAAFQSCLLEQKGGDMDALCHLNNANYFRYMEQARLSWFERLGVACRPGAEGPVIITASCTFLKPILYPATVEIAMSVGAPGRSSFPSYYEIYLEGDSTQRFAEGESVIVWTDYNEGKSRPLPDWLRELLPSA